MAAGNGNGEAAVKRLFWLGVGAFIVTLVLSAIAVFRLPTPDKGPEALTLTTVILVGLALVVVLMVLLVIFYKVTGIEDGTQALGLPSGSVRALIAFCLVLMFVCLGVFLYQGVNAPGVGKDVQVKQDELDSLKKRFTVVLSKPVMQTVEVAESTGADGKKIAAHKDSVAVLDPKTKQPLYDVTYFPDHSNQADDFAKLIFTQLATVFVTVIGFYFGSSTAAAGVGTGVAAAGGPASKPLPGGSGVPRDMLNELKILAFDAAFEQKQAQSALDAFKAAKGDADNIDKATTLLTEIMTSCDAIQAQVGIAKAAGDKFGIGTDAQNDAAASAITKARDAIKPLAATVKTDSDSVLALLKAK